MTVFFHVTFIAFSYSSALLTSFEYLVDPIIIVRTIMIFQFLPLLIVINSTEFSSKRNLLFLTFAICLSTLYVIDDFTTGFYGAVVDYKVGIVPRMRASAHLMAYKDTGSLVSLDYHADYFLEFVLVHFLSEVAGLNYVLTYFFIIRLIMIIVWSLVFVWSSTLVKDSKRRLSVLLLAGSILLANQGYNYEVSFAPVLLLLFYITVRKQNNRNLVVVSFFIVISILLASLRETLLLGLVSLIALCVIPLGKKSKGKHSESFSSNIANAMFLTLMFARIFLFASLEYFQGYVNRILNLINSIAAILKGGWGFQEVHLTTLESIHNPFDANIAFLSVVFALSILILMAFLSASFVLKKDHDFFSLALSITYLLALFTVISAYAVTKVTGSGIRDFSSATVLARSLLPLTVVAIIPYFQNMKKFNLLAKKPLLVVATIYLSIALIFAPFIFSRREVRSSYDMLRVSGDDSEYTILGNSMYEFIISNIPVESRIRILSPSSSFLQHYYLLPLQYNMGKQIETGAVNIPIQNKIFDNSIFTIFTYDTTFFLNELSS